MHIVFLLMNFRRRGRITYNIKEGSSGSHPTAINRQFWSVSAEITALISIVICRLRGQRINNVLPPDQFGLQIKFIIPY